MIVYRIAKTKERAAELSGVGAFLFGGRWNSVGTKMLYASENSSLAYLEVLAHLSEFENPPFLYIARIEIAENTPVYKLPENDYPANWLDAEPEQNKLIGDEWIRKGIYLAIKVKSALNPTEHNILLNPQFPNFTNLVKIVSVTLLNIDPRLR